MSQNKWVGCEVIVGIKADPEPLSPSSRLEIEQLPDLSGYLKRLPTGVGESAPRMSRDLQGTASESVVRRIRTPTCQVKRGQSNARFGAMLRSTARIAFSRPQTMRKLLACLLAFLPFGAWAASSVETRAFTLKLEGDWKQQQSSDPEQQTYYSKQLDVGLTTSFMLIKAKRSDTERIANKLKDFRLAAENTAADKFGLKMTIADPIVVPFSKGHQVAYYGHDNTNRQFRYLGLVLPSKVINIYAESKTRSQKEVEEVFEELLKSLSY